MGSLLLSAGGNTYAITIDEGVPEPPPTGSNTFYLADYDGADPTGVADSQDAFEECMADVQAYATANGSATLHLGGASNTWRLHPIKRNARGSQNQVFSYGVCMHLVSVSGITITGTSAADRPTLLIDAQPETEGGDPRDPADLITGRGEFIHVDNGQDITFSYFIADGQAPITYNANNWGSPQDGWDFSHKGAVVQFGSDNVQFLTVDMKKFRSEFVYANGDAPLVGDIIINGGTFEQTTASMFSCTANLTVQNLTVRQCPQGIENYAYASMDTVVSGCDVDTSFNALQTYESLTLSLDSNVVYEIVDNSGGLDVTNRGAANNNIGTTFTASSSGLPASWGTGSLRKYVRGNGIVIFNQRGTGTTSISNTSVANSSSAILMTDFAHNWTVSNFTATDVDSVFGLSNQNTSSTANDFHIYAGWRNFNISNLTVNATNRNMVSIVQSDGANQNSVYVNGGETSSPKLFGYYNISSYNTNGKHGYTISNPGAGETTTLLWTGTKWQLVSNGTVYYESTQNTWLPSEVTSWTKVSGANTISVTQHHPRDWTINGITINETGGYNLLGIVTSKAGVYNCTISNVDSTGVNNPLRVTTGEGIVYYPPLFDPATCSFAETVTYMTASKLRPLWGGTTILTPNTATEATISTDYDNYLMDGLQWTFKANTSTFRTLHYIGTGGAASISVNNSTPKTLEFDSTTKTWSEV